MSITQTRSLMRQAIRLADLIVQAKPARIRFRSEQQFLEMLGLQPQVVPLRAASHADERLGKPKT